MLRTAVSQRPKPNDLADEKLCFITVNGNRWSRTNDRGCPNCEISKGFTKLLRNIDSAAKRHAEKNGVEPPEPIKRKGRGIYALRHNTETIGGESRDQVAVDMLMGHATDQTVPGMYRETISDERLEAVADVIHHWLYGEEGGNHGDE